MKYSRHQNHRSIKRTGPSNFTPIAPPGEQYSCAGSVLHAQLFSSSFFLLLFLSPRRSNMKYRRLYRQQQKIPVQRIHRNAYRMICLSPCYSTEGTCRTSSCFFFLPFLFFSYALSTPSFKSVGGAQKHQATHIYTYIYKCIYTYIYSYIHIYTCLKKQSSNQFFHLF